MTFYCKDLTMNGIETHPAGPESAPGLPGADPAKRCLVFRSSLQTRREVDSIAYILDTLPGVVEWSVDLDDWEKVLRVVGEGISADELKELFLLEGVDLEQMTTDEL